jgi:DNA-directed RNA polymerase specialized sigma subunit
MSAFEKDKHFQVFTDSLKSLLASEENKYKLEYQKKQVETLVQLETDLINAIKATDPKWTEVFDRFIIHVVVERRNILSARPYFRERNEIFRNEIADVLAERNAEKLSNYHFNCCFVKWMLGAMPGRYGPDSEPIRIANEALLLRDTIIAQNMPLAISRAKLFWQKTQKSHLSYMDLVQISGEGLINAVDKFCLPYSAVFRAVIIGRITGNLIDAYSRPMLHFFPADKRKIYHANKVIRHSKSVKDLVERVNNNLPDELQTDESEIQLLMNAASHLSFDHEITVDAPGGTKSTQSFIQGMAADETCRPDVQAEQNDMNVKLLKVVQSLPIVTRKVLAMKGFYLEGMFDGDEQ